MFATFKDFLQCHLLVFTLQNLSNCFSLFGKTQLKILTNLTNSKRNKFECVMKHTPI